MFTYKKVSVQQKQNRNIFFSNIGSFVLEYAVQLENKIFLNNLIGLKYMFTFKIYHVT